MVPSQHREMLKSNIQIWYPKDHEIGSGQLASTTLLNVFLASTSAIRMVKLSGGLKTHTGIGKVIKVELAGNEVIVGCY